ncbi:hypothetical protein HHL22_11425 [Hymenobacter sp. RP-2-7]|uniref:Carboxypeptidase regulatory-like domain-containing protein n=1 Tax=Hymenobacter polaris TaxID=2682546 RepID=A0A7Y0AEF4_9BACT|nr:hypothetical protein [Hymenobacter polaris]NML65814.1 hypothetical protein [Hymenobacter polaris]
MSRVSTYCPLVSAFLLSLGASCAQRLAKANYSPAYELTRFKSHNPASAPLISGAIDQRQSDGSRYSPAIARGIQNFAVLAIDGVLFNSQPDGTYSFKLTTGRHRLRVGLPGLMRVDIPLRVYQGDSVRLDFHLRTDSRPLIN